MDVSALTNPANRVRFAFGEEMQPCPKCGSYNIRYQTPIKADISETDGAKQMLGKWAAARNTGATPLEGPVYIMCWNCFHKGPAVDCTGRTSQDVGKDQAVAREVKRLWNGQAI